MKKSVFTKELESKLNILYRHLQILNTLQNNEPAGIIRLSKLTEYPQHQVRGSLVMLQHENLIESSQQGAITTNAVPNAMNILKNELKEINRSIKIIIKTLN